MRGIDKIPLMPHRFEYETYKGEDILLVGTQPNKCISKWKTGMVTELISPQSVSVDVRDLFPFPGVLSPVEEENDTTLNDKELCVPITGHENDHVIGKDPSQSKVDIDDEESCQNLMEVQQEISEPSNTRLRRSSRSKDLPVHATYVMVRSVESVIHLSVTHEMPNLYTVSLVKSLFAGSPASMHETTYFIQLAHLHERTNACFKKKVNRYSRVSLFYLANKNIEVQVMTEIYTTSKSIGL